MVGCCSKLLFWATVLRPLKNGQFCSRSRKAKILTTGIYLIFRGLKFEPRRWRDVPPDAEIGQKGAFFKGLILPMAFNICIIGQG
jgi:hypothetical protein